MKLMKKNVYLNFKVESNIYTKEVLYRISKNTVNLGLIKSSMFVHSILRTMHNLCSPKNLVGENMHINLICIDSLF